MRHGATERYLGYKQRIRSSVNDGSGSSQKTESQLACKIAGGLVATRRGLGIALSSAGRCSILAQMQSAQ